MNDEKQIVIRGRVWMRRVGMGSWSKDCTPETMPECWEEIMPVPKIAALKAELAELNAKAAKEAP